MIHRKDRDDDPRVPERIQHTLAKMIQSLQPDADLRRLAAPSTRPGAGHSTGGLMRGRFFTEAE